MEIALLFVIAIELAFILFDLEAPKKENLKKEILDELTKEGARTTRRDVYGTFKTPLGDSYRKNTKGQYVPIQPNGKMLDGSEDE